MPPTIDINTDQQALIWRPHLLTEVMKTLQVDDLILEPVINPVEANDARIRIASNQLSLKWGWGNWKQVDVSTRHGQQRTVMRSYVAPQSAEVQWKDLPAVSDLELTFHNENGTTASVKVQVPDLTNFGSDVEIGQKINGSVRIRLLKPMAPARVVVELLRLSQSGTFKLRGVPLEFKSEQRQINVAIPEDFFGIIAVVTKQEKSEWLIAAADCHDDGEVVQQRILNTRLQKVIDSRYRVASPPPSPNFEDWLRSWPSDAQRRFNMLYDRARRHFHERRLNGADELLRTSPTGLSRYLVLIECGFKASDPPKLIRQLNSNSFQNALDSALPALGAAIAALRNADERTWAIQNAHNHNLQEAVSEAKSDGLAALARALHLADKRSEAIVAWESRRRSSFASAGSKQGS